MKSKILFIIVFNALLLNICHDFFVDTQTYSLKKDKTHSILCKVEQLSEANSLCHLDIHNLFHFVALVEDFKAFTGHRKIRRNMYFFDKLSSKQIVESSFKPPRT